MKPIWFFVGLILSAMGLIVVSTGIYLVFHPPDQTRVLGHLHPDIWWGILMTLVGAIYIFKNYRVK
jgi:hypothetical protein